MQRMRLPERVYRRACDEGEVDPHVRLRAACWAVFEAVDGTRGLAEVQDELGLSDDEMDECVRELIASDLLEECRLSFSDFQRAARVARSDARARSLVEHRSGTRRVCAPRTSGSMPSLPFEPLRVSGVARGRLSLRGLMRYIAGRHPDTTAGQLAVYRVFMGVNIGLLRGEGIETLRFDDDRFVTGRELIDALDRSMRRALGTGIPDDVFSGG